MEEFSELYDINPYQKDFDAKVISCVNAKDHFEAVLSCTAFYPEGGGQPADHGTLGPAKVFDVHKKDGTVVHYCDQPLSEGTIVHGAIDWQRRFDHMQNHSGEHIVSGLIHKHFGYDNVGFHMGETIQIDFDGPLSEEEIRRIETEANLVIQSDIPVKALFPSEEELKETDYRSKKELSGKIRLIQVEGADLCACCGTHVRHTGEIGLVKIISCEKHKKGVRLEMLAGMRALVYIQKAMAENHKISVALSASELETSNAVSALQQTLIQKDVRIRTLSEKILYARLDSFDRQPLLVDFISDFDRNTVRRYANRLLEKSDTAAVLSGEGEHWNYFIVSNTVSLKDCVKQLNSSLNGRGGGSKEMIQGSFSAGEQEIRDVLEKSLGIQAIQ